MQIVLYCGAQNCKHQITLITTEAEYVSFSHSLRKVIPLTNLFKEVEARDVCTIRATPSIFCKAFEDKSEALELTKSSKMRPRIKYYNLVYH